MRFVFITLIIISGCLPINKKLISPSELLYYTANTFFEDENYPQAIEKYKLFLEKYPASSLTASAKLNLGMFYYYQGNFKEAADILMAVDLKDENLKKFLDTVIKTCEEKIEETFVFMEVKEKETIPMEVLDAYANGAGDITLKGKISKTADVFADNAKGEVNENNEFIVSLS